MLIEDFLEFDRKELSFTRLIFRYYKIIWKILSLALTLSGVALASIALLVQNSAWLTAVALIIGCLLCYIGIKYSHARTQKVVKKRYSGALDKHELWDYKTIAKIRVEKMRGWLGSKVTPNQLQAVLVALQRKSLAPRYRFISGHLAWSIATLLAAAYISVLFQSFQKVTFAEINHFFRILISIGVVILGALFCFELMIIKELWQWNANKYERLIRTLENYLLTIQDK
jgi:hypothetical protein